MKKINPITIHGLEIISEPGDGTRYEYMMFPSFDDYYFLGSNNFNYPAEINKYEVLSCDVSGRNIPQEALDLAKKYNCNPCTVAECIRTIQEEENLSKHIKSGAAKK